MKPSIHQDRNHFFLYDADQLDSVSSQLFDPDYHRQQGTIQGEALGRGTTHYVRIGEVSGVLRHYRRGGMVANILTDQYLWQGLEKSRAWQEWNLLKELADMTLPTPLPIVARVIKKPAWYTADIITARIDQTKSLAEILRKQPLTAEMWQVVGRTIKLFHDKGVYHADLNAHNILVDEQNKVYLIDFDKGEIRDFASAWQQANLERLQRSLKKLGTQISPFYFHPADWFQFMDGYGG